MVALPKVGNRADKPIRPRNLFATTHKVTFHLIKKEHSESEGQFKCAEGVTGRVTLRATTRRSVAVETSERPASTLMRRSLANRQVL